MTPARTRRTGEVPLVEPLTLSASDRTAGSVEPVVTAAAAQVNEAAARLNPYGHRDLA